MKAAIPDTDTAPSNDYIHHGNHLLRASFAVEIADLKQFHSIKADGVVRFSMEKIR